MRNVLMRKASEKESALKSSWIAQKEGKIKKEEKEMKRWSHMGVELSTGWWCCGRPNGARKQEREREKKLLQKKIKTEASDNNSLE